jgi:hypothetical protein
MKNKIEDLGESIRASMRSDIQMKKHMDDFGELTFSFFEKNGMPLNVALSLVIFQFMLIFHQSGADESHLKHIFEMMLGQFREMQSTTTDIKKP